MAARSKLRAFSTALLSGIAKRKVGASALFWAVSATWRAWCLFCLFSCLFLLSEQGGQEGKRDGLEDLDFYMGKDALEHSTTHQISYPIRHGLIEVGLLPPYSTVETKLGLRRRLPTAGTQGL